MAAFILFGVGSALVVDYEESCRRAGHVPALAVANRATDRFLGDGVPVIAPEALRPDHRGLACLCPLFTPGNRMTAVAEAEALGLAFPLPLVDPTAIVASDVVIGGGSFVNAGAIIGARTTLGRHVVVNRGASIGHHNAIGDFVSLGPGAILAGNITVGDGAMIGAGAVLLPGLNIGAQAVVGAGAVVTADVASGTKVLGTAARAVGGARPGSAAAPAVVPAAPRVSVVIKSYNHAKYIRQTIASVLEQTFQDFEIIVTDDGSTDGTPDVVRAFADPRIKLDVLPENRGLSTAMNLALARATGSVVAILNSDDYALPDRLAKQVTYLDAHPDAGAVFTPPLFVDEEGRPRGSFANFDVPLSFPDHRKTTWLRYFFLHGNCLCAPSAMLRRDALLQTGGYDPRLTNIQDLDVWVRFVTASDIHVVAEPLTAYRVRDGNANLSAPRRDAFLRYSFEFGMVLRRFLALDVALVNAIFAPDLDGQVLDSDLAKRRWLAERALATGDVPHRLFGVETYYDLATTDSDVRRLREITGSIDLFGLFKDAP